MTERISTGHAARILGFSRKTLLKHAKAGKIPGAAELFEGMWRFDEAALRSWIRRREAVCQELAETSIREEARGTPEYRFEGAMLDAAYEQLLGQKR